LPPDNEHLRLIALKKRDLLDTPPEQVFDRITRLASRLLCMPISLVSLIDETRQWFKSRNGLDAEWTSRDLAFCAHAILQSDVMVVADATLDRRFEVNRLVTGDPKIRFYAGAPLVTNDGFPLGTLCVIDRQPHHDFSQKQQEILRDMADLVMIEIEARAATLALKREVDDRQHRENHLKRVLAEKDTLLKEVHHRVGNNLQVIDTLLSLEIRQPVITGQGLRRLRRRVQALGVVYRKLILSEDLKRVCLADFVRESCSALADIRDEPRLSLIADIKTHPPSRCIDFDLAIPLGLVISELLEAISRGIVDPSVEVALTFRATAEGQASMTVRSDHEGSDSIHPGEIILDQLLCHLGAVLSEEHQDSRSIIVSFHCPD